MSESVVSLPSDEPVIVIERIFDAPQALTFRMFTEPYHLTQFWGPAGCTNPVCEMDVRPGGRWHHVMRFPSGQEYSSRSVYLEVVEPTRIVYRDDREGVAGGPPPLVTTILFEDVGGKTKVIAQVRAVSFAARDDTVRMGFTRTVAQSQDRLEAYLATL